MEIKLIEQLGLNDLDVVEALIDDLENAVSLFNWLENINVSKNVREFLKKCKNCNRRYFYAGAFNIIS